MSKTLKTAVIASAMSSILLAGSVTSSMTMTAADAAQRLDSRARPAEVTVTIRADGVDLSGQVVSSRPLACAADRTVNVYKLIGGVPHLWASDTTQLQGRSYRWSIGNTGQPGRFYAEVKASRYCKGDRSRTVIARREG